MDAGSKTEQTIVAKSAERQSGRANQLLAKTGI
jgi:hypothetical protein